MREEEYLQCINFGLLIKDKIHNQTIPIVLAIDDNVKVQLESSEMVNGALCNGNVVGGGDTARHNGHSTYGDKLHNTKCVALKYENDIVALLDDYEIYAHRKEERSAAVFKTTNSGHPSIQMIQASGDWLIGGNLKVLQRITWNDGLDQYRLTPREIRRKLQQMNVSFYLFSKVF